MDGITDYLKSEIEGLASISDFCSIFVFLRTFELFILKMLSIEVGLEGGIRYYFMYIFDIH